MDERRRLIWGLLTVSPKVVGSFPARVLRSDLFELDLHAC
jgi:hypothetical protein